MSKDKVINKLEQAISQEAFTIAIDMELQSFLDVCRTYDIMPRCIFKSSIDGEERLHATFHSDIPITDIRMCYAVHGCIVKLFNSKQTNIPTFKKELRNMFVDSWSYTDAEDKQLIYDDDEAVIDVPYLIEVACFKVNKATKGGNGSKNVRSFLKAINLQYNPKCKGCNMILFTPSLESPKAEVTKSCDSLIYIISYTISFVKIGLAITTDEFSKMINGDKYTVIDTLIAIEGSKASRNERDKIDSLIAYENGCKLLMGLSNGDKGVSTAELRGLAQALCTISGAQKTISEWMMAASYAVEQVKLVEYLMGRYRTTGYFKDPVGCDRYCRYYEECREGQDFEFKNVGELLKQRNNQIIGLRNHKARKDAAVIRRELWDAFEGDLTTLDNKIYIYKCFVGVGKTLMYLEKIKKFIAECKTVLIALPSHKVKDDIERRLYESLDPEEIERNVIIVPEIPKINDDFNDELDAFYTVGDYKGADKLIKDYTRRMSSIEKERSLSDAESTLEKYSNIIEGLREQEYVKGKIIITTHERLFSLSSIEPDLVIIDEDITGLIYKYQQVDIAELDTLNLIIRNTIENTLYPDGIGRVVERIDYVINKSESNRCVTWSKSLGNDYELLEALLKTVSTFKKDVFNSRVLDLLFNSSIFIKRKDENNEQAAVTNISFLVKRPLKFKCKVFIMSATVDQEISERAWSASRVIFRDFNIPRLKAVVSMQHNYSYSRKWFGNNLQNLDDYIQWLNSPKDCTLNDNKDTKNIEENRRQLLIITFMKYENEFLKRGFKHVLHFGNITGLDEYKGMDLAVFGTPNMHSVQYLLYTKAIFPEDQLDTLPKYERVLVENGDYRFYMWTCKESDKFRKIHMWAIESELIQSIGRVRPIDNECLIRIYSSYPPSGLDICFLNN